MRQKKKRPNGRFISVAVKPTAADHSFNLLVDVFLAVLLVIIAVPLWSTITLSFRPNDYIAITWKVCSLLLGIGRMPRTRRSWGMQALCWPSETV